MTMPPEDKDPRKVSTNRLVLWIVVSGIGVYLIISGLIGVFTRG
jgi:hypothetical protein